ncbi:MAG: aminopeptidase P family protein [Patescibacteria group bacterium]|nr:aminopeptidase P family protein [Patescibacteria group bacterium]
MFSKRVEKVRDLLKEKGIDSFLVTSPMNLTYLSGFECLSPTEREAYIFITKKSTYIMTSPLYAEEVNAKDFSVELLSAKKPLSSAITSILKKEALVTVGFEVDDLKFFEFDRLSKKDIPLVPSNLYNLRTLKDPSEIEKIAQACEIGDKAFSYILQVIKPGMTEEEVALELELFIRKQHATLSFPSIVAFGEGSAVPHHITGKRTLQKNEFVLLDFGVKVNSYCSDMTRTVFVGKPSKDQQRMYHTVKEAQDTSFEYVFHAKEIIAGEIDQKARDYIISRGFADFPHCSHGIGLEVHEAPSLAPSAKEHIIEGMVFSVEPGIYFAGQAGVRIEDLIAIEPKGPRLLTKSSRELITI